jgi:lipopolysaccharide export system protein LptA
MSNRRLSTTPSHQTHVVVVLMLSILLLMPTLARGQQEETGFKHDADQPIEVVADTLEVAKDEETAIFQGNVNAVQGKLALQADTLKVKYRQSGQANGGSSPFSRIDAMGNVVLTSAEETATGDWAVYDVDSKTVTLGGAVVLTREENVINGQRLVVDLVSGRSRVDGGNVVTGSGNGKQRVRAVFTPKQKEERN